MPYAARMYSLDLLHNMSARSRAVGLRTLHCDPGHEALEPLAQQFEDL